MRLPNITTSPKSKKGRALPAAVVDSSAYSLYPSLDLNTIPFHVGAGAWGAQAVVQAPAAPITTTNVSVSTWADFESACLAGARQITVTASISGVGNPVSGSCADLDIIVNPGVIINNPIFGLFGQGNAVTRIRLRGPTLGTYSGGQVHNMRFFGLSTDIHIDGIGLTGGGPAKEVAIETASSLNHQRMAITNCRGMAGNAFYLGNVGNLVVAGCSVYSGADLTPVSPNDEAWNFRCTEGKGPVIFFDNDLRNPRFHNIRVHPNNAALNQGYVWASQNLILDYEEARIFWAGRASAGDSGNLLGAWLVGNSIYAEDNDPVFTPDIEIEHCPYGRVTGNTFYGDFTVNDIYLRAEVIDGDKTGNTFNGSVTEPAWSRVGDPTGLDWSP